MDTLRTRSKSGYSVCRKEITILPTLQSLAIALTLLQATLAQAQTIDYVVPVYSERVTQDQRIEQIIKRYDWDTDIAIAVMMAESSGKPDAYNPEWHKGCQGSYGLFQIACIHSNNPKGLFNEETNIEVAYNIWKTSGWKPWSVCLEKVDCSD